MSLLWVFFFAYVVVWGQKSCTSIKVMVKLLTATKCPGFVNFTQMLLKENTKNDN